MSKKLPKIRFVARPAWQKQRLAEWLQEWNLELSLRGQSPSETPSGTPSIPFLGATVGFMGFYGLAAPGLVSKARAKQEDGRPDAEATRKLVRPFDHPIAVGQVRLLSSELTPDTDRPVFVAVFGDWDEGEVLMAPFSPFSVPATTGEWLTARTSPVLRVLQIWNTRTVPITALEKSWLVDDFADVECKTAWQIFEHEALGKALASELEQQVGPPLVHPDDPRRQYLDEEFARLDVLQSLAEALGAPGEAAASESEDVPEVDSYTKALSESSALEIDFEEALAAGESNLPEQIDTSRLLPGFTGFARRAGEGAVLTFSCPAQHGSNPPSDVVVVWPDSPGKTCSFREEFGRWMTTIEIALPWRDVVALLGEGRLAVTPAR